MKQVNKNIILGNICRERSGGQGFLSINRLDACIYGGHSGITAEGDSSVLMQKVSKEYVEDFVKGVLEAPVSTEPIADIRKKTCVFNIQTLLNLIRFRESVLLTTLADITMKNMTNIYDTWMKKESDLIQDLALTFAERYCLEETFKSYNNSHKVIADMVFLYAATIVRKNLSWYLINDYISKEAANKLLTDINKLIANLGKISLDICEGFGLPKDLVSAPMYTGYQEYYKSDITGGEHYDVALRPKF
jgi:acyl-CoA oxidase